MFVIVMENRSYAEALAGRYTARLASEYSVANAYHGVSHPSLPNYLALTSGSTWGITDDGYHRLPAGGLGAQLTSAHILWQAYMEGMTNGCFNSPYPYALKHNPFAYYGGS
ncbi:MAG TPA: alkaline phosphatase family protein, partial [Candidatus Dormibacteraeota bacterium]